MKSSAIDDFETNFHEVLGKGMQGDEFVVYNGRKNEKDAVLVPYKNGRKRLVKLGVLEGVASYKFQNDFEMTDEEFIDS